MLRMFFYSNHREDDLSIGITKKVRSQIKEFKKQGFEVYFSAYYNKGIGIFDNSNKLVAYKKCYIYDGLLGHWLRRIYNLVFSTYFIAKNEFDFVYLRYHFWDVFSLNLLRTAKSKNAKVVVEAHSYPYKVNGSLKMKLIYVLDDIFSTFVNRYIDFVAAITDSDDKVWGCKTIKIENAVNTDDSHARLVELDSDGIINLVCVANEQLAHGIPRLLYGMEQYYESTPKRDVILWLVGEYLDSTKKLVHDCNLDHYVNFVGKKHGEELFEIYNKANLGIGPLAAYLSNYHKGVCLKTKEYFAVGLPFVTAAADTAEVNYLDEVFVVPEDNSPIKINDLIVFSDSINMDQEKANAMNTFAKIHYSWEDQINKIVLELLDE